MGTSPAASYSRWKQLDRECRKIGARMIAYASGPARIREIHCPPGYQWLKTNSTDPHTIDIIWPFGDTPERHAQQVIGLDLMREGFKRCHCRKCDSKARRAQWSWMDAKTRAARIKALSQHALKTPPARRKLLAQIASAAAQEARAARAQATQAHDA